MTDISKDINTDFLEEEEEEEEIQGVSLKINDDDITSGSILISWCVNKELLDYFNPKKNTLITNKNIDYYKPVIAIFTSPIKYNEIIKYHETIVVPLSDLATYIQFNQPGKHRIFARIFQCIYDYKKSTRFSFDYFKIMYEDVSGNFVSEDNWNEDLFHTKKRYIFINDKSVITSTYLDVEVPDGIFAKEPPSWGKIGSISFGIQNQIMNVILEKEDY